MLDTTPLLAQHVSFQENAWKRPSAELPVSVVLDQIHDGKCAHQIERLRLLISRGDKDGYTAEKKHLPGVTFSATFDGERKLPKLTRYTNLLVLDIDHIDPNRLPAVRQALLLDPHVMALWRSPSGSGLKGLVPLTFAEELAGTPLDLRHRAAFDLLSAHILRQHNVQLDRSGCDVTRLCFLSSDRDLSVRALVEPLVVGGIPAPASPRSKRPVARMQMGRAPAPNLPGQRRRALYSTEGKNRPHDRALMRSLHKYLRKRGLSITADHDHWFHVAYAIANTFSYDIGQDYFLRLCRLDGAKHDEDGSACLLQNCYYTTRGEISIATVLCYAQEVGYNPAGDRTQY